MRVRAVQPHDWLVWERMRYALWPGDDETHGEVVTGFFNGSIDEPQSVLLLEDDASKAVGFVELSIRTDLVNLPGVRVGYVEGLYLEPHVRGQANTRKLLAASRRWAREHNCVAFASDRADRVIIDTCFSQKASQKEQTEN